MARNVVVLLRNNLDRPLALPSVVIPAGKTVKVERWNFMEDSDQVKSLLRVKAIEIVADRETKQARRAAAEKPLPDEEDEVRKMGPVDAYIEPPEEDEATREQREEEEGEEQEQRPSRPTRRTRGR